jgi:PilZ domain
MHIYDAADVHPKGVPAWWPGGLRTGHLVELTIYGDSMTGHLREISSEELSVTVPVTQQAPGLMLSRAYGTATISMEDGAARVPVSCWAAGDVLRLHIVGPVEFIQRRGHVRVAVRLPAYLGWLRPGDRTWDHARSFTVDISVGGVQVAPVTTVWPSMGAAVQVMIDLPDGPWQTQAEAVGKTRDYGLRLRFADLDPMAAERIRRLAE